ncbi:hypothetical protein LAZ40_09860 [Cereibacter sphaeroides]|uniref:hypothetical protein n=1 Tax=Cereibacter sphaeroides TaxID=1063 RepID=UPI001F4768C4|nr:hypothetical protein [Cereibacter sphaeroides]MCE6959356.1 hypothetical protein [Cereibacter sphaeroides]MCE6972948.1 hypothetical protein [Cereibacter sphaeroides]
MSAVPPEGLESQRAEIMAPFERRQRAVFEHRSGLRVSVTQEIMQIGMVPPPLDPPPPALERQRLMKTLFADLSRLKSTDAGWMFLGRAAEPVQDVGPEPENQTPQEHHDRVRAIVATLSSAGVTGIDEVRGLPAGWTRVLEQACDGIASRMSLPDAGTLRIDQMKEKFGTLRFYVSPEGDPAFVEDIQAITDWAEQATESRCCVTGRPGEPDRGRGWILTLCEEMRDLRERDPDAFRALIYPPEPEGAESRPGV